MLYNTQVVQNMPQAGRSHPQKGGSMKPALFNSGMVKAILNGTKTQTRRPMKPQPRDGHQVVEKFGKEQLAAWIRHHAPYAVGDVIYVRETFWRYGSYVKTTETCNKLDRPKERFKPQQYIDITRNIIFEPPSSKPIDRYHLGYHKRPSLFMLKWAARIFLEVTAVRCERVQDISEAYQR